MPAAAPTPSRLTVLHAAPGAQELSLEVVWIGKPPTRLPEALWLRMCPGAAADPSTWQMSKLGSWVSPGEVMLNGSHSMHAVDDAGVRVAGAGRFRSHTYMQVTSLDAALVSPGLPMTVIPNVGRAPDMASIEDAADYIQRRA